ncbi:hypothetical protein [Gimesia algae]|nr:hypothetical protein [Gimesia algae]
MNKMIKDLCLIEELESSHKLIVAGLGDLQDIDMENDFYHLPHQLLASGLERLMKCFICLVCEARNGSYPTFKYLKKLGHDLSSLNYKIYTEFYNTQNIQLLEEDLAYLKEDSSLHQIIHILSEFGKYARYYNLDVITGNQNIPINPTDEWEELEASIEDKTPYLHEDDMQLLYRDYYPRVHSKIISKLERFLRAIAMQFTLGNHGVKLQRYSMTYSSFRNLKDEDFGNTDYRRSVKILKQDQKNWTRRSSEEIKASNWPKKRILKSDYPGEWPFRSEEVTLECRNSLICIINIAGFDFALNGMAAGHLNLPFPHDAGIAIFGKSVGPFIDMALELGK